MTASMNPNAPAGHKRWLTTLLFYTLALRICTACAANAPATPSIITATPSPVPSPYLRRL